MSRRGTFAIQKTPQKTVQTDKSKNKSTRRVQIVHVNLESSSIMAEEKRTFRSKQQVIDGRSTDCGLPHAVFILLHLNPVVGYCERLIKRPKKNMPLTN